MNADATKSEWDWMQFLLVGLCLVSCRHVNDHVDDTDSGSADSDSPADSNSESDADADGDSDADSDADADSDSATDTATDTTTDSDSCEGLSTDECWEMEMVFCGSFHTENECRDSGRCVVIDGRPVNEMDECLEGRQFASCSAGPLACGAQGEYVLDPEGTCWVFGSGCIPDTDDGWSPAPHAASSDHPCFYLTAWPYDYCTQ